MPRPRGHLGLPPPHRLPPSAQYSKAGGGTGRQGATGGGPAGTRGGLVGPGGSVQHHDPTMPRWSQGTGGAEWCCPPQGGVPGNPRRVPAGTGGSQGGSAHCSHSNPTTSQWSQCTGGEGRMALPTPEGSLSVPGGSPGGPSPPTTLTPPCPSAPPVPGGSKLGSLPI